MRKTPQKSPEAKRPEKRVVRMSPASYFDAFTLAQSLTEKCVKTLSEVHGLGEIKATDEIAMTGDELFKMIKGFMAAAILESAVKFGGLDCSNLAAGSPTLERKAEIDTTTKAEQDTTTKADSDCRKPNADCPNPPTPQTACSSQELIVLGVVIARLAKTIEQLSDILKIARFE